MELLYVIAIVVLACLFVLFLVMGKTLNNTLNQLTKLEYLLRKESDLKKEVIAINAMLKENILTGGKKD